ncbi:MAG: phosphoglycerate dehydrogenase [Chloroflexota bacterium]
MRILVAEQVAAEGVEILRAAHDVDERVGLSHEEYLAILPDYDALMVRSQVQVDAAMFAAGTRLVVVGRAGVGVDNVDLEAATKAGVIVVNAPTGNTIAAAEHTLALLYALARNVAAADASVRRGEWKRAQFTGVELRGKTLGLIGFGKIGQAIAVRAQAMEMPVLAIDPLVTAELAANFGVELVELPELLARADVVSLHVPKTRTTAGMIGAAELARMKPTAFLLNVARGGVVDERALADALAAGTIAGAGIDVYDHEPPSGSPLLEAPRTVLTPHLGASTAEAQVRVAVEAAQQVIDVLDGRPARYAVNAPLLTPETARATAPYLPLTETLGSLLAQFERGGVERLTIEVAGELAEHDPGQLTAAALRGLLEGSTTERVNLVNATLLAKARGIEIVERRTPVAGAYASLVTLVAETSRHAATVAGTIANGEPRLVRIDDYRLDMAPATRMLIMSHRDRPGMVGRIGALLGAVDVNISAMTLARMAPRAEAIMLLALDEAVPDEVAAQIRSIEGVIEVWVVYLGRTDGDGQGPDGQDAVRG